MQMLFKFALGLHVIAGYSALLLGLFIMIATKGNSLHRKLGSAFFYIMLGVTVSALLMAGIKSNEFLFYIGVFVFYQNYGGWKSIRVKSLEPDRWDWLILLAALANGIAMLITGNIVLIVFGSISVLLVVQDLSRYRVLHRGGTIKKNAWLARHIGMMIGAYIATLTAFLVVNIQNFQPFWVLWLAPTLILIPLMQYWTWKYTRSPKKKTIISDETF